MPFGSYYGVMYLAVLSVWLVFQAHDSSWAGLSGARFFVALLALSLALGLILKRGWARWAGVAFGLVIAVGSVALADPGAGLAEMAIWFGSIGLTGLLATPATGDPERPSAGEPAFAVKLGHVVAMVSCIALVGSVSGFWWAGPAPSRQGPGAAAATPATKKVSSSRRVDWADYGAGLAQAEADGQPVLVSFETSWCGYCKKMNRTTWKDPNVVERLNEMVAVRVNAEDTRERNGFRGADVAERYGVTGYPTLILLEANGRVVSRTGGYMGANDLLSWIERSLRSGRSSGSAGSIRAAGT